MRNLKYLAKTKGKKIISFSIKTNGVFGDPFALSAIVYSEEGKGVDQFFARCPIKEEVEPLVKKKILPRVETMDLTHKSYQQMLASFVRFLSEYPEAVLLVNKSSDRETLFQEAFPRGIPKQENPPKEWIELSPFFTHSMEEYMKKNKIFVDPIVGRPKNPVYESVALYKIYRHLIKI